MGTITLDGSHALAAAAAAVTLIYLFVVFCILVAIVVSLVKSGKAPALSRTVEADAKKLAGQPIGKTASVDVDQLAAAVAAQIQNAPPLNIPNHPALTAVAEAIQEGQAAKTALAQVASLTAQANAAATKTPVK